MEVRIGVVYTARELTIDTDDSVDVVTAAIESAVGEGGSILWLTDTKGRRIGVPTDKIAYVEIAADAGGRKVGFGASWRDGRMIGPAPELLDRRLLFFTGKGGVGKSTIAAATAMLAADIGKRVLLIEVDAKGDVPAQFEQAPVGFAPREMQPGVLAMAMDTEASLQEYLKLNLRVPVIGRLGPMAKALDFVATAAPGVKEILTIGKIVWEVRESIEGRADHDLVVVDAAATGHIVAQLGAADAIRDLVDVGPLRSQTQWVSELLADPQITAVNIVTTPEEMPVVETIELADRLRREVRVPLGSVIVNRVLPELFTHSDEEAFEALRTARARDLLTARAGAGATKVLDAARLAVSLRRTGAVHLEHLLESVGLPALYVPYLFVRAHGLRVTRMVADALGEELGTR